MRGPNHGNHSPTRLPVLLAAAAALLLLPGLAHAVNPHRPIISNISPNFGPVAGGTTVTFTGTNLRTPITVNFGANAGTGCDFSGITGTSGTFTCDTPASTVEGPVTVTVKNHANGNSGTLVIPNGFTYTCDGCTVSPVGFLIEGILPTGTAEPNGILEPNEGAQAFAPTWLNASASTITTLKGSLSNSSDANLTAPDASATYPSVAAGASAACSGCYTLQYDLSGDRPQPHIDATIDETPNISNSDDTHDLHTWTIHIGGTFPDEPSNALFYTFVERLVHNGVTSGCNGGTAYCGGDNALRGQMAAFLSHGLVGVDSNVPSSGTISAAVNPSVNGSYDCSNGGTSLFSDVSPTDVFCKHIHFIAGQDITVGCGGGNYCENTNVDRTTMAIFLARAIVAPDGDALVPDANTGTGAFSGRSYDCTNGPGPFTDVAAGSFGCAHIGFIWTLGIVDGFGDGTYGGGLLLTRDQMSKFLVNAFNLSINTP